MRHLASVKRYSSSEKDLKAHWLYTILLNFHRMETRRNKPDIVLVGSPQDLPQISDGRRNEVAEEIREMVRRLPPKIRETIVLKYFSGMSMGEIAEALDISPT